MAYHSSLCNRNFLKINILHYAINVPVYIDPYEGEWIISITKDDDKRPFSEHSVVLIYSKEAKVYWGYSGLKLPIVKDENIWLEVFKFLPIDGEIDLRLVYAQNSIHRINHKLKSVRQKHGFISKQKDKEGLIIEILRRK